MKSVELELLLAVCTSDHLQKEEKNGDVNDWKQLFDEERERKKDRKRSAIGFQLFDFEENHSFMTSLHLPE